MKVCVFSDMKNGSVAQSSRVSPGGVHCASVCGSSESTGFAACDHTLTHTRYLNPLHAKLTVVFLPDQSAYRGATASVECISLPAALYYCAGVMNDALVAINF